MRSLGYDNITLILQLTYSEWIELKSHCRYYHHRSKGTIALIPDKIFFEVAKILGDQVWVHCSLNIPKIVFGHNILLANHTHMAIAFERAKRMFPFPVDLEGAMVKSVHFTYTQDTPYTFDQWRTHFRVPKGGRYWEKNYENGRYINSKRVTLLVYGKDRQIRSVPKSVTQLCDHDHLLRIELRLNKSVLSQLRNRRLWALRSFIGADLCSPEGYSALSRLYEWRTLRFIALRKQNAPSAIEAMVLADLDKTLKFLAKANKAGRVSDEQLAKGEKQLLAIRESMLPHELVKSIQEECERASPCSTSGVITGNFAAAEMEYVKS